MHRRRRCWRRRGGRRQHCRPAFADLVQIVGCGQTTVIGAATAGGEISYETAPDGDGTVPRALAVLPDVPAWYVAEEHGGLPGNAAVAAAVVQIIATGRTTMLSQTPAVTRAGQSRMVAESALLSELRAATSAARATRCSRRPRACWLRSRGRAWRRARASRPMPPVVGRARQCQCYCQSARNASWSAGVRSIASTSRWSTAACSTWRPARMCSATTRR